jgi:hypothetical protein
MIYFEPCAATIGKVLQRNLSTMQRKTKNSLANEMKQLHQSL